MTTQAVKSFPQEAENLPWWAGNARLTNLSRRLHGNISFQPGRLAVGELPEGLKTAPDWSQFSASFLIGGAGGAIAAYLILTNLQLFAAIAQQFA